MQSFGEVNVMYTIQSGKLTTATYFVAAQFKNSEGPITARLVQSPADRWQFLLFEVQSPAFLQ
jgi:hypothetical protein